MTSSYPEQKEKSLLCVTDNHVPLLFLFLLLLLLSVDTLPEQEKVTTLIYSCNQNISAPTAN